MIASSPVYGGLSEHLSHRSKEAAVRSLEGPPTLPLTCVTSACRAIKVRQSSTVASLYLWHYAATFWLARFYPPPSLPPSVAQGICHSPVISFINSCLLPTFLCLHLRRRERNHWSEKGDHFAPVLGLAAVKDDTSGRC